MIITQIKGGLGNQMFQYAFGRKLSLVKRTNFKLDIRSYNNDKSARKFMLDIFKTKIDIASVSEIEKIKRWHLSAYIRKPYTLVQKLLPYYKRNIIKEKCFTCFDKNYIKFPANCILIGYWQSYKYFESIRDILLKEFKPQTELDDKNKKVLEKIHNNNSISIHIRRGDYINNPIYSKFYRALDKEYYLEAIKIIKSRIRNPKFFIFGDEIEWFKENIQLENATYIDFNQDKPFNDLFLMNNCKHNIMANSTFSWWGAWLNNNNSKIVITPEHWFKGEFAQTYKTTDLLPDSWIKL